KVVRTVSAAEMKTGTVGVRTSWVFRVRLKRIRRNNEPPISDAVGAVSLQQFRRIPAHRITAIRCGHHFDAVIYPGERPHVSVILRNNVPRPHRREVIVHYRHKDVTRHPDWLGDELLDEILDDIRDSRVTDRN